VISIEGLFDVLQSIQERLAVARAVQDKELVQVLEEFEQKIRRMLGKRLLQ
jgi:hypothetical protein